MTQIHYQAEPLQPGPVRDSMVSVVLPTYNEAGNIIPLMERILAAVGPDTEIIVVDDDSPDGTGGLGAGVRIGPPPGQADFAHHGQEASPAPFTGG